MCYLIIIVRNWKLKNIDYNVYNTEWGNNLL